jgi:hypothetical protein
MMTRKLIAKLTSSVFLPEIQHRRRRMKYEDKMVLFMDEFCCDIEALMRI